MASANPSNSSEDDPDYEEEEGEEETDYNDDDDDEEVEDDDVSSDMEAIVIPENGEDGIVVEEGEDHGEGEEVTEYDEDDDDDWSSDQGWEMETVEVSENGESGIGGGGEEQGEESEEQEERNEMEMGTDGGGGGKCVVGSESGNPNGVDLDRPFFPNCPVCLGPWTSDGPHRVCCIPCGHIYGRSCLEKWIRRCRTNNVKCPMCNTEFKQGEIINLYAPLIAVRNDELEKEMQSRHEKYELLRTESMCSTELQLRQLEERLKVAEQKGLWIDQQLAHIQGTVQTLKDAMLLSIQRQVAELQQRRLVDRDNPPST